MIFGSLSLSLTLIAKQKQILSFMTAVFVTLYSADRVA